MSAAVARAGIPRSEPAVVVRSVSPGRVRMRVLGIRERPALARHLEDRIAADGAVRTVTATPVTGGVLIVFEPAGTTPRRLVSAVRRYVSEGLSADTGERPTAGPGTRNRRRGSSPPSIPRRSAGSARPRRPSASPASARTGCRRRRRSPR